MKKIEQKVITFIKDRNLISPGDKILAALSGGPDSVAMLFFLNKYKKKYKIQLEAVHVNHMLRGKEADEDQIFCEEFCRNISVPFISIKKNVKGYSIKKGISLEEAGREIRYKLLNSIIKTGSSNKIATAHNSSDNTETVLLNLIKGTGLKGISGIPVIRGNLIRPFLCLSKEEILEYITYNKLEYRTDPSNSNVDFERNFLRHEVIPLLKQLNPSLVDTINKSSDIFKNIFVFLAKRILQLVPEITEFNKNELKLNIRELKGIEPEIINELFKYVIERNFSVQTTFNDLNFVSGLINKEPGRKVDLASSLTAVREREYIKILRKKEFTFVPVNLSVGEKVKIYGKFLYLEEVKEKPSTFIPSGKIEFISGDNIDEEFIIRPWKSGDRFYPIGMSGSKKVSDFLNAAKVESGKKNEQLIMTNRDRIVWVIGLRLDERFKIRKRTKRILKLCLK